MDRRVLSSILRVEVTTPRGVGAGTAVALACRVEERVAPFLVTCRHVVEHASNGRVFFALKDGDADRPAPGEFTAIAFEQFHRLWRFHPDAGVDVAVAPLAPMLQQIERAGKNVYCPVIDESGICTREHLTDVPTTSEIVVAGFPEAFLDQVRGLPLMRRATFSTPPRFDSTEPSHLLIESAMFSASAGSPLFALKRTIAQTSQGLAHITASSLVGILSRTAQTTEAGDVEWPPVAVCPHDTAPSSRVLNLGVAVAAPLILEALRDFLDSAARSSSEP